MMNNDLFEKMPIPKAYMKLALPNMTSSVLMLLYNMIDMFWIARTEDTNLVAGVAICAPIFTFLVAMGDIFGLGGSSVISRLFGMKKIDDGRRLSVFVLLGSAVFGFLIALVLLIAKEPLLALLGAKADTFAFAEQYYFWIALGAPTIIFSLVPSNLLRTEGYSSAAMTGSIIGSIVNIVLDPIFIFSFNLGAAGAAIATIVGNIFADAFFIWFILKKSKLLSINPIGFHISKIELLRIFSIGIPSSVTNVMTSIGVVILNRFLLEYGTNRVAAMGIVQKIIMVAVMIMVSFSFGGQPLYGYLYGAHNNARMKETLKFAYLLVCSLGFVTSVFLSFFAKPLIGVFMHNSAIINAGVPMIRILLSSMTMVGFIMVTTCLFQACGKASGALLLSAGRQGYVFALTMLAMSSLCGYKGVIWAQPCADMLTAVLAFILFRKLIAAELE